MASSLFVLSCLASPRGVPTSPPAPGDRSGRSSGSVAVYLRSTWCRTSPDCASPERVPGRQHPRQPIQPEAARGRGVCPESFKGLTAPTGEGFLVEGREADVDLGALAFGALDPDLALVCVDDPLG